MTMPRTARNPRGASYSAPNADGTQRYIVILREAPLAAYKGETAGYARIPAAQTHNQVVHPDVNSTEAQKYVSHLAAAQQQLTSELSARFGRQVAVASQFQHALNAIAVDLTAEEAAQVQQREDVLAVPVTALVALLEGGYAVEVLEDDGTHRYVRVDPGLFQDGAVEVAGDGLAAGDIVVTAR